MCACVRVRVCACVRVMVYPWVNMWVPACTRGCVCVRAQVRASARVGLEPRKVRSCSNCFETEATPGEKERKAFGVLMCLVDLVPSR